MISDGKSLDSPKAPEPMGCYPHARRVGSFLFLSGVGPRRRGGGAIPGVELDEKGRIVSYDIRVQCESVFENVKTILEECGASWEDLVDVTVFLTNMKDDFGVFNQVYGEYFKTNRPCRTTLEVGALPTPIAVELKCLAMIGEKS